MGWEEKHVTHCLKKKIKQVTVHLDFCVFIKAWGTNSGVKAMTEGLKWINTQPFSVLFLQITVIWGETQFNCIQSVWMDFFSSLALYELQQLDDLFFECSASTGGLFQLNLAQHLFCFCLIDSELHVGLSSFELFDNHKLGDLFSENRCFNFHFLTELIFILQYMLSMHFKHLGKRCF